MVFVYSLLTAPSEPLNLEAFNNGHKNVFNWNAPEFWNGPLSGYQVSLKCPAKAIKANITIVFIEANEREVPLHDAEPGVPCLLSVRAFNLYDDDTLFGPPAKLTFTPDRRESIVTPPPS